VCVCVCVCVQGPEYVIVEHEARQERTHSAQLQQTPRLRVQASAAASAASSAAASLDFSNKMQKAAEIAQRQEEY
jgi:hypothetical protein